jgi:DNA-binding FadR family transcriptional regulator
VTTLMNAPLVRTELADGVADRLRDAILAGDYAPGDALPSERDLSRELGANRTTVREGLAQLEHQGLVERRQGTRGRVLDYRRTGSIELLPDLIRLTSRRGASAEPSPLASTNEVLRIVYDGALDLAFERVTATDIADLVALAGAVEDAAAARDRHALARANRAFHQGVARAAHSIALELLVGSFYRVVDAAAARPDATTGAVAQALVDRHASGGVLPHRALADAIASGDRTGARAAVRQMFGSMKQERATLRGGASVYGPGIPARSERPVEQEQS